jgi:hypothetical protein
VQSWRSRRGFKEFGDQYPQHILFIAGLPKSGTTWLKKMVADYPGFHELLIPQATAYELATGGSHDYDLPRQMFSRLQRMLVVTKMHVHGSPHNVQLLHSAGIKYVVLYRDLRDVAVSYVFYVRQTPWHPEYRLYSCRDVREGLALFAERTLLAYVRWVASWHQNRDPQMGLMLTYEQLLADTSAVLTLVAEHFELDSSEAVVHRHVTRHSFRALSGGRERGEESDQSFFRSGTAGSWTKYFDPDLRLKYDRCIGDFLIEHGYERDHSWSLEG